MCTFLYTQWLWLQHDEGCSGVPNICKWIRAYTHVLSQPESRTLVLTCMCGADKPVNSHSPPKDVAALLLAVAEKLKLERSQSPQSSDDSGKATNIVKTKLT